MNIVQINFSSLFTNSLNDFINNSFENIDNSILVYLHIPKAAGNTSIGQIKEHLKPSFSLQWNDIDGSIKELIETETEYKLVSGHLWDAHIDLLRENNYNHYAVTFLRHPIQRIISQYRYMCTPKHPEYESFLDKHPNFDDFALNEIEPNYMAKVLVGSAKSFDEYWAKLKERYAFIGLSEYYNTSMALLMNALNLPYKIAEKKNVTVETTNNSNLNIDYKVYDKLTQIHSLDIQIFNYLNAQYAKLSEKLLFEIYSNQKLNLL